MGCKQRVQRKVKLRVQLLYRKQFISNLTSGDARVAENAQLSEKGGPRELKASQNTAQEGAKEAAKGVGVNPHNTALNESQSIPSKMTK